jgi:Thiolase, N-terminal domain
MAQKVVAVVGMISSRKAGQSETYPVMGAEAVRAALADARVGYESIQQAFASYIYGDLICGQRVLYDVGMTGIPIVNVNNNCASGSPSIYLARQAIASGDADVVLAGGFEQMNRGAPGSNFPDRPNPLELFAQQKEKLLGKRDLPIALTTFGGGARPHETLRDSHGNLRKDPRQGQPSCGQQSDGGVPQDCHRRRRDGRSGRKHSEAVLIDWCNAR